MSIPQLNASAKTLEKVFCPDYAFRIPIYQRSYSWNEDQVAELISDLDAAMSEKSEISTLPSYFLEPNSKLLLSDFSRM
jgi:uncharacterized protein with ParB-like and HNH nuclease domain